MTDVAHQRETSARRLVRRRLGVTTVERRDDARRARRDVQVLLRLRTTDTTDTRIRLHCKVHRPSFGNLDCLGDISNAFIFAIDMSMIIIRYNPPR